MLCYSTVGKGQVTALVVIVWLGSVYVSSVIFSPGCSVVTILDFLTSIHNLGKYRYSTPLSIPQGKLYFLKFLKIKYPN